MTGTKRLLFFLACGLPGINLAADTVILKSGFNEIAGTVNGTAREIGIQTPEGIRSIPVDQVFSIRFGPLPAPGPKRASAPTPAGAINIPIDTPVVVRTIDAVDSKTGDTYREYAASLDEPIVVNQITVVPAKTNAILKIREIKQAGKLKGSTTLSLGLIAIVINGQRIELNTGDVVSASSGKGKATVRDGAIGAAAGCGLGTAAAGAVGCEVGSAVGAVSGVVTSALNGKTVKLPPETRLTFKLTSAVVAAPVGQIPSAVSATSAAVMEALKNGDAHANAHEYQDALKDYQKALDINKRSSLVHYSVAQVFVQRGNFQGASSEYREALAGDRDAKWVEVWAHIGLGEIFNRVGQRERAISEYVLAARTEDDTNGAQSAIADYQKTLCPQTACPDYLSLRNGGVVTGNWLSSDGGKIQFLADDMPRTYEKSAVWEVFFGIGAPPAPLSPAEIAALAKDAAPEVVSSAAPVPSPVSATPPSVPVSTPAPQAAYSPEPELIGAVYFRDDSGELIPLERTSATDMPVGAGIGYSPLRLYRDFYVVDGSRSPVRIKSGQKPAFVVRLANGVDPRVFNLYPMDTKKGKRGTRLDSKKKTLVTVQLNVTRAGASSYAFMPDSSLTPGEYAFSPRNSNDAYCFGIDP